MKSFSSILPFIILIACVVGFSAIQSNRIAKVELAPASITMEPGETLQLEATAYTRGGKPVAKEDLGPSELGWQADASDNSFSVDENGLLTAICEGNPGTVQAYTKKGHITSRPVTVQVISAP